MGEIKVRTYVKKDKKMIYGRRAFGVKMFTPDYAYIDNEVEVMLYTGLKDSEGQDVYEGDVLSNGEHINWQVVFHDGSFKVALTNLMTTDKWILNSGKASQRKIVGNIWENPELRDNW